MDKENVNIDKNEEIDNETIYVDPILLDTDNLIECKINSDKFQEGINDFSYYAGAYTVLVSSGFSNVDAMNLILSKLNIDMNIDIAESNKEATVEASKNQNINLDKTVV